MELLDESIFPEKPVVYATFWQRLVAVLIDALLIGVTAVLLKHMLFRDNIVAFIAVAILRWLYYALQESGANQATIGKKAMNIKVVNANGGRISIGQGLGRVISKNLSSLILFIGFFMVLWDDDRQSLHDKIASTYVICA
jgi:uncharacterized RDD family membrane protein YckC